MHRLLDQAEAVFFDLDGTLVDSATDIHAALSFTIEKHKLPSVTESQVRGWIGRGAKVLVDSAYDFCLHDSLTSNKHVESELSAEDLLADFLVRYQTNVCEHTRIYDGVLPLLNALKASGKQLACITNKPIQPALTLLDTLNLSSFFSLVLGGDSLEEKKPHPLPLQHALAYYELQPEQAVMVGDSKFDVLAAQATNMSSIAVSYGYNHGVDIALSEPTIVVSSFLDLL